MMVTSAQVCVTMTLMRPFQEMLARGLVKCRPPRSSVAFISHEWLARHHPDPDGLQLRVLQHFLKATANNQIKTFFSEKDWGIFKSGTDTKRLHNDSRVERWTGVTARQQAEYEDGFSRHGHDAPDEVLNQELAEGYLWVDYMSVPQDLKPGDDSQQRAIFSISYYIEQCSYFIVLCPSVRHADTGDPCDYESWWQRGWCRFEDISNILSGQQVVPVVLTEARAYAVDMLRYFSNRGRSRAGAVACGDFSCCRFNHRRPDGTPMPCDKDNLLLILERRWIMKVQQAAQARNQTLFANLKCMETWIFARSDDEPFRATWGNSLCDSHEPEIALQRLEEDRDQGLLRADIPLIHLVARIGDERILQLCVERHGDPLQISAYGLSCLQVACCSGSEAAVAYLLSLPSMTSERINYSDEQRNLLPPTALHGAAFSGYGVELLLKRRAHHHAQGEVWRTPLHVAARFGNGFAVQALLAAGAPMDAQDKDGATALHLAAVGFDLWSRRAGRLDSMRYLLATGSSTNIKDKSGLSAAAIARSAGNHEAADMIEDAVAERRKLGQAPTVGRPW